MTNATLNRTRNGLDKHPMIRSEPNEFPFDAVNTAEGSRCQRCGGFLVPNHCLDLESSWGDRWCTTLRCVQCGELIDPLLLRNRRRSLARLARAREGAAQPHRG